MNKGTKKLIKNFVMIVFIMFLYIIIGLSIPTILSNMFGYEQGLDGHQTMLVFGYILWFIIASYIVIRMDSKNLTTSKS